MLNQCTHMNVSGSLDFLSKQSLKQNWAFSRDNCFKKLQLRTDYLAWKWLKEAVFIFPEADS